jgi:superfamily II DNA or RNA helicase
MKSNFEFLNDEELTREYYSKAVDAETSYCIGQYASAQTAMRAVAENMARDIADQLFINIKKHATFSNVLTLLKTDPRAVKDGRITKNVIKLFYKLKQPGNVAAHTLTTGNQQEALASLKTLYILCVWFSNSFFDKNIQPNRFEEPRKEDFLYSTVALQPKVEANTAIYIQTVDQSQNLAPDYEGQHKIGQATIETLSENNTDNSPDLRRAAQKRIDQYMKTSGLHSLLEWAELAYRDKGDKAGWFTDHDVHHVLENSHIPHSPKLSGNEWFQTDVETAKKAIKAVKAGVTSLDELQDREKQPQIKLRPEQEAAIKKTIAGFRSGKRFLWNAKMRFGKTLTALKLVKEEKYQKVLIMTHRPVVDEGWFEDFQKMEMPQAGYVYGTKKLSRQARKLGGHDSVEELEKTDQPYIFFASIQDLGGSESVGGKISDKNQDLFDANWDLVIVDEAHEGTQTELTQNILKRVLKKKTKELDLSGTPFNILSSYDPDHVFTWDYTMEQTAKSTWSEDNPGKDNPYADLPKVSMFTFEMTDHFTDPNYTGEGFDKYTFNFKEFFRVDKNGNFVHEKDVERFLDNITNPGRNNYPFSTRQFRNRLRHTLWIMPGIKEANALEDLLEKHSVFGKEYRILNVVRNDKTENNEGSDNDAEKENEAIAQADKEGLKTITLTVRKLTTGATIPEWTAVLFLANTNSAMQYLQAAFRAQTPYNSPEFGKKENCYIFDFAPDRALTVMAEASSLSTGVGKLHKKEQKQRMTSLMNFLPIIGEEGQRMKPFKVDTLLAKIKRAYAEKAVRTGFDDDSIYSDALLTINETDLKLLKDVKAHVGSTKKQKLDRVINVNKQGLTEAEYDQAEEAKKKKPRERTPEEQAAIDKEKQQKEATSSTN